MRLAGVIGMAAIGVAIFAACGTDDNTVKTPASGKTTAAPTKASTPKTDYSSLSGSVTIDGSSTVGPVTEAVAEEFGKVSKVRATVGISGTGGGFEKFCKGETDINDASRAIKDAEKTACTSGGIEYVEFQIGIDGITVVVNPKNDFVTCLTVSQLRKMWDQGSTAKSWSEIDPSFPAKSLVLFGPGTDSGTFDFFTEAVSGTAKKSRSDYTASEDDNTLVRGVENEDNAIGYFGYAYYVEAGSKLKSVQIDKDIDSAGKPLAADARKGCITPSSATINDNSYPLSRPLFIYVNKKKLAQAQVEGFVRFYLENAAVLVKDVGYVSLPDADYAKGLAKLDAN